MNIKQKTLINIIMNYTNNLDPNINLISNHQLYEIINQIIKDDDLLIELVNNKNEKYFDTILLILEKISLFIDNLDEISKAFINLVKKTDLSDAILEKIYTTFKIILKNYYRCKSNKTYINNTFNLEERTFIGEANQKGLRSMFSFCVSYEKIDDRVKKQSIDYEIIINYFDIYKTKIEESEKILMREEILKYKNTLNFGLSNTFKNQILLYLVEFDNLKSNPSNKTNFERERLNLPSILNSFLDKYKDKPNLFIELEKAIIKIFKFYETGQISALDFYKILTLFSNYNPRALLSIYRCKNISLQLLTPEQIANINIKNLNSCYLSFVKNNEDYELYDESLILIIQKMYLLFGEQKTCDLFEGYYGEYTVRRLVEMVNEASTDDIEIPYRNAEPYRDKADRKKLRFLFGSSKNDSNANMRLILQKQGHFKNLNIPNLLNKWEIYFEILSGNITAEKLVQIIKNNEIVIPKGREELSEVFSFINFSKKIITTINNVYNEMQTRVFSTIPKVNGYKDGFEYEMLDLKDPFQLSIGYKGDNCCIFNDNGESCLVHGSTELNGRFFIVKYNGVLVAQSWVWRNGSTICFDNIELSNISSNKHEIILNIYKEAADKILNISKENELPKEKVSLVTIGKSNTKIPLASLEEVNFTKNPAVIEQGIRTDAERQIILVKSETFSESEMVFGQPIIRYQDERYDLERLFIIDLSLTDREIIQKIVNKVNYFSVKRLEGVYLEDYTEVIYNNDWYILIKEDGTTISSVISYDKRAVAELETELHKLKQEKNKIRA